MVQKTTTTNFKDDIRMEEFFISTTSGDRLKNAVFIKYDKRYNFKKNSKMNS